MDSGPYNLKFSLKFVVESTNDKLTFRLDKFFSTNYFSEVYLMKNAPKSNELTLI